MVLGATLEIKQRFGVMAAEARRNSSANLKDWYPEESSVETTTMLHPTN